MDLTPDLRAPVSYRQVQDNKAGQKCDEPDHLMTPNFHLEDDNPKDDNVHYSPGVGGSGVIDSIYPGPFVSPSSFAPFFPNRAYTDGGDGAGGATFSEPSSNSTYSFNELSQAHSEAPSSSTHLTCPSYGYPEAFGECQRAQFINDKIHLPTTPYVPQQVKQDLLQDGHTPFTFHYGMETASILTVSGHTALSSAGSGTGFIDSFDGSGAFDGDSQDFTDNVNNTYDWDPQQPHIRGPLYSSPSTSGDYSLQHEPKRQTDQIIYLPKGFDAITLEATECNDPRADTPSALGADNLRFDSTGEFGNLVDGSTSTLVQNMQFGLNNSVYDHQIPGFVISMCDVPAPLAGVLREERDYQLHCRRLSESDIIVSEGVYGSPCTHLDGNQPNKLNADNIEIDYAQIQRKRKPSVEIPPPQSNSKYRVIAPNKPCAQSSISNFSSIISSTQGTVSNHRQAEEGCGEQDVSSKSSGMKKDCKNCHLCRLNRIGNCAERTQSTRCSYCQIRFEKIIDKSACLEQALSLHLAPFLDKDLHNFLLALRKRLVQNHQANDSASYQIIICHIEPHLDFRYPTLYSDHSHFLPIKLEKRELGADSSYYPVLDISKLQDFVLHSMLTMYPTKYHEANRGIISTALQCCTFIAILFNMANNKIYFDSDFTAPETKELALVILHSILCTIQSLLTKLQEEVNESARSKGVNSLEVFCAVSALCTSINSNKDFIKTGLYGLDILNELRERIKSQAMKILGCLKDARKAHGTYSCTNKSPALQRYVELVDLQSRFKPAISIYFEKYSEARLSHADFPEPTGFSFAQILQATSFPIQEAVENLNHQALALSPAQNISRGNKASRAKRLTEASLRALAIHPAHLALPKYGPRRSISLNMENGEGQSWIEDSFSPRNLVGRDDPKDQKWKPDEIYALGGVGTWVEVPEGATPSHLDTLES